MDYNHLQFFLLILKKVETKLSAVLSAVLSSQVAGDTVEGLNE